MIGGPRGAVGRFIRGKRAEAEKQKKGGYEVGVTRDAPLFVAGAELEFPV